MNKVKLRPRQEFPVWTSDIFTLEDNLEMILSVSEILGKSDEGKCMADDINSGFSDLKTSKKGTALYLIWNDPYMAVGRTTYINDMMRLSGFENVLSSNIDHLRYPILTTNEIKALNPDFILLSSEPFPFQEKHIAHFQAMCPTSKIILVDGEMYSWYGFRSMLAPEYFKGINQAKQ